MNHDRQHHMLAGENKSIASEPARTGKESRRERRQQERKLKDVLQKDSQSIDNAHRELDAYRERRRQLANDSIRVFRFNGTEYVKSLTLQAAIEYFSEECDPGIPDELKEIPADQWDDIMLRNSEYDEDLPEDHPNYMPERLPLSAFVVGSETELIGSPEW